MSYIPDIRSRKRRKMYNTMTGKDAGTDQNSYWQGYLNKDDAMFLGAYDTAMSVVSDYFNNLEIDEDKFQELDIDITTVDQEIIASNKKYSEYSDEECSDMSKETKMFLLLKENMFRFLESERNNIGVSMIDQMSDVEYEAIKSKADTGEYKNILIICEEKDAKKAD